jgi:hypothetical protein
MKALALVCLLHAAILLLAADTANVQTARYRYPWGSVIVSFDPKVATRTEVDRWMRLSPELSPYNDLLVPIDIRRCVPSEDGYTGCGKGAKLRISNIDLNIRKMLAIKKELDAQKVPQSLRPVVAYLSEVQNFALWRTQRQREFFLTRDVSMLRNRYADIDPSQTCSGILQEVARSSQEEQGTKLMAVDWANCVWQLEAKRIGPYPKAAWQAFLKDQKITEVVKEELPND